MKQLKIAIFEDDFKIELNSRFQLRFYSNKWNIDSYYPLIFSDKLEIDVPNEKENIIKFCQKEIPILSGEDAYEFLDMTEQNMISILNLLMKENNLDLLFYTKRNIKYKKADNGEKVRKVYCVPLLLANVPSKEQCVYFDGKMLPYEDISKIRNTHFVKQSDLNSSKQIENIKEFIQKKVTANFKGNILLINEAENLNSLLSSLDREIKNPASFNLMKTLEIYDKIFSIKNDYYGTNSIELTKQEQLDIAKDIDHRKSLPQNVKVNIYSL